MLIQIECMKSRKKPNLGIKSKSFATKSMGKE
jgi:hypothetical protein